METLSKTWFSPVFSSLIQNRTEGLVIVGALTLQTGLHMAGLPVWACPFKSLTGIPCPGCGLTTATGQLFAGKWAESIQTHAFATIFVFAFFVVVIGLFLPGKQRKSMLDWIAGFEQRTGITALILVALLAYWGFRLAGLT